MGVWVITVCGAAILSVLCDVIMPDGQTKKYIKTVVGIVVTFVIVQPLLGIFDFTTDKDWISANEYSIEVKQTYLDDVKRRQNIVAINKIKSTLNAKGITVNDIKIYDSFIEVKLDVAYSVDINDAIKKVIAQYFPDNEIITIWK